jgi:hypothetical protein
LAVYIRGRKKGRIPMAIAVEATFHGPGLTIDKYFESLKLLGAVPEGPHPDPSCLFHWVEATPNGYRVTDVWKDKPAFEKFVEEKVGPVSAQLGAPQPQLKYFDVANYATAGS